MKRLGIFVFFNDQGMVEPYVEVLLKSLTEIVNHLLIVVNGIVLKEEKEKLETYSNHIYQRANIGFDGGAYKDVFLSFSEDYLEKWNEILLLNDTFYGPLFSWDKVFEVMEGRNCDFWGLSCHLGGYSGLFKHEIISPHVQSYFIVIKKSIFMNSAFRVFWENLSYPVSFKEAVYNFEIYFSEYFVKQGFCFESWIDVKGKQLGVENADGMTDVAKVTLLDFPIFKRKSYQLQQYINLKAMFRYIVKNTEYPIEVIERDICWRGVTGKMKPYNTEQIKAFCDKYRKIYLYGMGKYSKNIYQFLMDNGINVSGYIVSKMQDLCDGKQIFILNEFTIASDEGVIVALNEKNFIDAYTLIKGKIPAEQLICPIYGE